MIKSRQELRLAGTILEGIVVADWFKDNCDGCSAKAFKGTGAIKELTSACIIHDAEYTLIPIAFPIKSKYAKIVRKEADKRLLVNCKAIIGVRGRRPIRRFMLSRAVYYAVRIFARSGMTPIEKKAYRMPRTLEQHKELSIMVRRLFAGLGRDHYIDVQLRSIKNQYVK